MGKEGIYSVTQQVKLRGRKDGQPSVIFWLFTEGTGKKNKP